jgi:hypothetical protein
VKSVVYKTPPEGKHHCNHQRYWSRHTACSNKWCADLLLGMHQLF